MPSYTWNRRWAVQHVLELQRRIAAAHQEQTASLVQLLERLQDEAHDDCPRQHGAFLGRQVSPAELSQGSVWLSNEEFVPALRLTSKDRNYRKPRPSALHEIAHMGVSGSVGSMFGLRDGLSESIRSGAGRPPSTIVRGRSRNTGALPEESCEIGRMTSTCTEAVVFTKSLGQVRRLQSIELDEDLPMPEPERPSAWAALRRIFGWNTISGILVVLNAVCVGVSCDVSPGWHGWLIIDTVFAAIFFAELCAKCWSVGPRPLFVSGQEVGWNLMELAIVVVALVEVAMQWLIAQGADSRFYSVLRTFRALRATRVARVIRLQIFQELTILVKGLLGGLRVLCVSLIVLFLPLYSTAVIFRETLGNIAEDDPTGESHFGSIGESLFTVFRCTVAGDCDDLNGKPIFVLMSARYGWGYGIVYSLVVVFVILGLFNVIAAIFVEQVVVGAKTSAMLLRRNRLRDKTFFARKITELVRVIVEVQGSSPMPAGDHTIKDLFDRAKHITISPEFFDVLRQEPRFCDILNALDVPDEEQFNLFETLDADGNEVIDMEELVEGIARLRGETKRSDIIHLIFMLKAVHADVRAAIDSSQRLAHQAAPPRLVSAGGDSYARGTDSSASASAEPRGKPPAIPEEESFGI